MGKKKVDKDGFMILTAKGTEGYFFQVELPHISIAEARNRLWSRLIARYRQERVLRHRGWLAAAVNEVINRQIDANASIAR